MKQGAAAGVMSCWGRGGEVGHRWRGQKATAPRPSYPPPQSCLFHSGDSVSCCLYLWALTLLPTLHSIPPHPGSKGSYTWGAGPRRGHRLCGNIPPQTMSSHAASHKAHVSRGNPVWSRKTLGVHQKQIVQRGAHRRIINKLKGIKVAWGAGRLLIKGREQWASDREPVPRGRLRQIPLSIIRGPHFQFEWMPPVLPWPVVDGVFWFKKQKAKDSRYAFSVARVASVPIPNRTASWRTHTRILFPIMILEIPRKVPIWVISFLYILSFLAERTDICKLRTYPVPGCESVSSPDGSIVHMHAVWGPRIFQEWFQFPHVQRWLLAKFVLK